MRTPSAWLLVLATAAVAQEPTRVKVRDIDFTTRDIYTAEQAEGNLLYSLANLLHATTRDEVARRELWFGPGVVVTREEVEEVERNLRAMRLFGEVSTELTPNDDGTHDLAIRTRDRFTLSAQAGASAVGGVTKTSATLAENNLFGTGKQVAVNFRAAADDRETYLRLTDPQLFGGWHRANVIIGDSDHGPFFNVDVTRPFKHLADPYSYGIGGSYAEREVEYYLSGDSVAQVPEVRREVTAFAAHAFGPRDLRGSAGFEARWRTSDYSPAKGSYASSIRVPGDTEEVRLGPTIGVDWRTHYEKVTGLDTLDYVEDLWFGVSAVVRPGLALRDEVGRGSQTQPLLSGVLKASVAPCASTYLTFETAGSARWHGGDAVGWKAFSALHAYPRSLPLQTLAASLTYEAEFETQDLPPQLTLGEDNGLRGYPAREFAGTRVMRLNLEDRIDTGITIWSVHVGAVAFTDVGWVHGDAQGLTMDSPIRSVGVGLRFGSSNLLGNRVVRLDFAWPLDEVGGTDYGMSISASMGQVFGWFGNLAELKD